MVINSTLQSTLRGPIHLLLSKYFAHMASTNIVKWLMSPWFTTVQITALYCNALYYTALNCIVLHCIVLDWINNSKVCQVVDSGPVFLLQTSYYHSRILFCFRSLWSLCISRQTMKSVTQRKFQCFIFL